MTIHIRYEDGHTAPYRNAAEAMDQASHDAKYGFGVPEQIEDDKGKVIKTQAQIRAEADKL